VKGLDSLKHMVVESEAVGPRLAFARTQYTRGSKYNNEYRASEPSKLRRLPFLWLGACSHLESLESLEKRLTEKVILIEEGNTV
jgi:hypothetical protein